MDLAKARALKELADNIGEQFFNVIMKSHELVCEKLESEELSDAVVRDAAQSAFSCFITHLIGNGKGIEDLDERQQLCSSINDRIAALVTDIFLETGAQLLVIDLPDKKGGE